MAKNYVYSDLSAARGQALFLDIDGTQYEVAQFSSSWGVNSIPSAVCMLAIGREAKAQTLATVHTSGQHQHMKPAYVVFFPQKEYSLDQPWPGGAIIFDGFFVGFAYRKISGKVYVVANLIHWLAALTFSSCVSETSHVSNPTDLTAAAVLALDGTGGGQGANISSFSVAQVAAPDVLADMWRAISSVFCGLAEVPQLPVNDGECGGGGESRSNAGALEALKRMSGAVCGGGEYYKALAFSAGNGEEIATALATAIGNETIESYAATSFWDKLVGQFCPTFGIAVVPRVDGASVFADLPAYRGGVWKTLKPDEYDSFDMSAELRRPLQSVMVVGSWTSETIDSQEEVAPPGGQPSGCYAEDSIKPNDGIRMIIQPPSFMRCLRYSSEYAGSSTGVNQNAPTPTSTTPTATPPNPPIRTSGQLQPVSVPLYNAYAQNFFVNQMMRGRAGSVSGKLRFDIAPGSQVRVEPSTAKHIGAEDSLAVAIIGYVQQVNITINSESPAACTTLSLTHLRTDAENGANRTSCAAHPLYGGAVVVGHPLVEKYKF